MLIDSRDVCLTDWAGAEAVLGGAAAIDAAAFSTGAMRRRRDVRDGSQLFRLAMHYSVGGSSLRTTAAWSQSVLGPDISDVALLGRLRHAGDFLAELVARLLWVDRAPLERWDGPEIRLVDGCVFSGPGGGQHRLHAAFDPLRGRFTSFELTDHRGAEKLTRADIQAGDVAVADRNYAKTWSLREIAEKQAFFVVRAGVSSMRMIDPESGERLDAKAVLAALGEKERVEIPICVIESKGKKKGPGKKPPVPARLVVTRASAAAARRETARVNRSKIQHKATPRADTRAMADVVMIVTNLPRETWTLARVEQLYRLRWQIELAFKLLKSTFAMREVPANDPALARSWILANLAAALLARRLAASIEADFSP